MKQRNGTPVSDKQGLKTGGLIDLAGWGRDTKFSFRSLRRTKTFTLAVVLTFAVCIGANATIMSILYGLILKPLPFGDSPQLVEIYNSQSNLGQSKKPVSVAQYLDFKANADLFEDFALWRVWTFNMDEESDPVRVNGTRVTADYFKLLGIQPLLGRFFDMEECVPGRDRVVVLTQSFWEKRYNSDPAIIGQNIRLTGEPYTVIGVAPRTMEECNGDTTLLKPFEWAPQQAAPQARLAASYSPLMYARIKNGVAHTTALSQLRMLEQRFSDHVAPPAIRDLMIRNGQQVAMGRIRDEQTKSVRSGLFLLQGGAMLVLLLGCLNVTNLMLARIGSRETELTVRQALGASFGSLARQLLIEALLLASAGAAIGWALAWACVGMTDLYLSRMVREVRAVSLDGKILCLILLVSFGVALLVSLLPLARIWRGHLLPSLQRNSYATSQAGRLLTANRLFAVTQIAFSFVLLVGALLLVRSFANVMAVHPGFDAARIHHGRVALGATYQNVQSSKGIQDRIMTAMHEIAGVEAVGISSHIPVNGQFPLGQFPIRGSTLGEKDTHPTAFAVQVSPGFFKAMGLRIVEGRDFTSGDLWQQSPRPYVVDQDFAAKYFPGRSAVGELFSAGPPNTRSETQSIIIGVVESAKLNGLEDLSGTPFVFPLIGPMGGFSIVLRSPRPMADLLPLIRQKLHATDPSLPLYSTGTLNSYFDEMLANRRGILWLLGAFAGIALLLAAIGIYGILAHGVTQRTKEIGIRSALGASPWQIALLIARQGLWCTVVGLVFGWAGALFLGRYVRSLLFELKPEDPLSYVLVSLLLLGVAFLASWLPMRRALKIDPAMAMRVE